MMFKETNNKNTNDTFKILSFSLFINNVSFRKGTASEM